MLSQRCRDESGVTLVELLVVVIILGVIGGVATSGIITGLHATRKGEARVAALNDLQKGIERVGRELRAAEELRFEAGSNPAEVVIAQIVRGGERVRYRYYLSELPDGSVELREDIRRETLSGAPIGTTDGLFIADIANVETGQSLFTYFRTDPVTGAMHEIACDPVLSSCLQEHATATQVRLTLDRLLPEQDPIRVETVLNIRSARLGAA
jgi:prepilin-type N-terminal cleavage/methylation domain-containing protein